MYRRHSPVFGKVHGSPVGLPFLPEIAYNYPRGVLYFPKCGECPHITHSNVGGCVMSQCHLPSPALIVTSNTTSYIRSYPAQKLIYCPSVVNSKKGGSYGEEQPTYWFFVAVWSEGEGVNILQGVVTHVALIWLMVVSCLHHHDPYYVRTGPRARPHVYSGLQANIS